MKKPVVDYDDETIDFGDGMPISYWWEDMRPKEIRKDFLLIYEMGKLEGAREIIKELGLEVDEERLKTAIQNVVDFNQVGWPW